MAYKGGLTDGEIRLTGLWDDAALTGPRILFKTLLAVVAGGAPTAFVWGPEGNTVGMEKTTGLCLLSQYDESSPVDNFVAFTATLKISGTVTDAVF